MSESVVAKCPCKSGVLFEDCCAPVLNGAPAATPEALMRARYSAYVLHKIDFLKLSLHPSNRSDFDERAVSKWASEADWQGLEILNHDMKGDKGNVEFICRFKQDGILREHKEKSEFRKEDGSWYFWDGQMVGQETVKRDAPKVGRNDPCLCGSGKKFKKCCG